MNEGDRFEHTLPEIIIKHQSLMHYLLLISGPGDIHYQLVSSLCKGPLKDE